MPPFYSRSQSSSSGRNSNRSSTPSPHNLNLPSMIQRSLSSKAQSVSDSSRINMSHIEVLDEINFGTFGRVYRVRIREETPDEILGAELAGHRHKNFALKVMAKETIIRLQQLEHVKSETMILLAIRFPFIVELYAVFQDEKNHYMLMEHVYGGDLFERMKSLGAFSECVAKFYAAELVLSLEHLHSQKIVHRDLKPENLMIDENGHLKVIDFGFSKVVQERTWTICGTPEYMAPEVIQNRGHGPAVDWWSLGVLIYEMVVGNAPFYSSDQRVTLDRIVQGHFLIPSRLSIELIDLLKKLLVRDLSARLGNLKNGVDDIKGHPWFRGIDWDALLERKNKGFLCQENMERFMQARARQIRLQQQHQKHGQANGAVSGSNSSKRKEKDVMNVDRSNYPSPRITPLSMQTPSIASSSPANSSSSPSSANPPVITDPECGTPHPATAIAPLPSHASIVSKLLDKMDIEFPPSNA